MTGPLFTTPALPESPDVRRAMDALIREIGREGIPSFSYMVPLYDEGELVQVIAGEEYDAGPKAVTSTGGSWDKLLTLSLELDKYVAYRLVGTASCDFHADTGTSQETLAIRVRDGTNTLHTLYGTSAGETWYTPITVPFTLELKAISTLSLVMDGQHIATAGSNPSLERIRLIAVAIPIFVQGVL